MKLNNFINFNLISKTNDLYVYFIKSYNFLIIINYFKNKINFVYDYLVDVFVCDYVYYIKRFRIVYNLSSFFSKNNMFFNESLKILDRFVSLFKIFKCSV